jgi:hypothetical protein
MKTALLTLLFIASMFVQAQDAPSSTAKRSGTRVFNLDGEPPAQAGGNHSAGAGNSSNADAKLHDEVLQLIELSGIREEIEARKRPVVEQGKKLMLEKCRQCAPEFADEWARRMRQRLSVDDFVAIYARAYEQYLTQEDVAELIALKTKAQAHEQTVGGYAKNCARCFPP